MRFRKKLLIFPHFQLSIIGINLGVIFTVSLVLWVAMENALRDLQPAAGLSGIEVEFYRRYIAYQTDRFRTYLFVGLGFGAALSLLVTLIFSHRFAGPLIRLRNYFREISEGKKPIGELSFRDGDYLGDLPPLINRAMKIAQGRADGASSGRRDDGGG